MLAYLLFIRVASYGGTDFDGRWLIRRRFRQESASCDGENKKKNFRDVISAEMKNFSQHCTGMKLLNNF
jgi:hypothetical protein